jgi:hypothetical protein
MWDKVLCNNDVKSFAQVSFALLNLFSMAYSYCVNLEDVVPRFWDRSEVCLGNINPGIIF